MNNDKKCPFIPGNIVPCDLQLELKRASETITGLRKRIAELEAELDRNISNLTKRAADLKVQLERAEEEVKNLKADRDVALEYINKPYPAPVAKPIVWYPWDGKGKPCVCFAPLDEYCLTIEEQGGDYFLYYHGTQLPPVPFNRHTPFKSIEAAKQAAQEWLNKLVVACTSVGNSGVVCAENAHTMQFTAEEADFLRKAIVAAIIDCESNPPHPTDEKLNMMWRIKAKCDALLKGVQG